MPDHFSATVDATEMMALLDRLGPSAEFVLKDVSRDTAQRVVVEAKARVARATGHTAEGIHYELSRENPNNFIVLAYSMTDPSSHGPVDYWLEYGTQYMYKRPFFHASTQIEQEPHLRRMEDRMQQFLDNVGR